VEGLTDPAKNLEVTEAIRALVDRIVLTPEFRPGKKRATLVVELEGALAAILHLAVGSKAAAVLGQESATSASGNARTRVEHVVSTISSANNLTAQSKEPPSLSDGGSSKAMVKLVAGAGYNEERTGRKLRLAI
jgi:hypothetical protein